ncbi:MAG: hypothetical protein C0402_13620 [Thermodesulfovibrio sp.]|nr:hypothetical protein [Thermodesulfovibrio sp.]
MRYLKSWLPVLLWMGFIFWMSTGTFSSQNTSRIIGPLVALLIPSVSQHEIDLIHGVIRKAGHVGEYFILGILLFRAFRRSSDRRQDLRWAGYSFIIVAGFAAGDEYHQSFVATRTASLIDVCLDISGGLLAQVVCILWYHRRRANNNQY